jgi:hypothetical protein
LSWTFSQDPVLEFSYSTAYTRLRLLLLKPNSFLKIKPLKAAEFAPNSAF